MSLISDVPVEFYVSTHFVDTCDRNWVHRCDRLHVLVPDAPVTTRAAGGGMVEGDTV